MSQAYHEDCTACDIRFRLAAKLFLLAEHPFDESPTDFWARIRNSGRVVEAVRLYDRLMRDRAKSARIPRETRAQFLDRVQREGRLDKAERALARLLESGLSRREAQEKLVERFQPLDGSEVRFWKTPDPWLSGRLLRRKEDQKELLAAANGVSKKEAARQAAADRIERAKHSQEERVALADARMWAGIWKSVARREARSQRT